MLHALTLAPIHSVTLRVEVLVFLIEGFLREQEDYEKFSTYPLSAKIAATELMETLV